MWSFRVLIGKRNDLILGVVRKNEKKGFYGVQGL